MIQNAFVQHSNGVTTVAAKCLGTGKQYCVHVPTEGYWKWLNGWHIQNAMPSVSVNDREFLISGYSPEGWDKVMGPDPDEEDTYGLDKSVLDMKFPETHDIDESGIV